MNDGDFGKETDWYQAQVKAGTTVVTISEFGNYDANDLAKVVDSYLVFEGSDAVRPEAAGVEVDGMTITAPATATGNNYRATLYTLDVTGTTTKHTVNIYIEASTISAVDQVDMVEVAISKDGKFGINFGDIFSKLDANSIQSINGCELTTANPDFFAIKGRYENEYYVANSEDIAFYKKSDKKDKVDIYSNDLRSITYAEVTLSKLSNGHYQTLANNLDNIYRTFDLQLTLTDGANEIKKIVVPVKVVAPEFSDYYKANSYAGWDANGNLNKTLTGNVTLEPTVLYLDNEGKALTAGDALNVSFDKFKNTADTEIAANSTLVYGNVLKAIDGKDGRYTLGITQLSATATANVATVENTTGASKDITVKTQFKVNLSQQFTGAKLVYFNNSVAQEKASVFATENGTDFIQGYYQSQAANATTGATAKYSGLAIQYAGQNRAPIADATINGIALTLAETLPAEGDINYTIETGTGSQGGELDLTNTKAIQFEDKIELGAGGKLNVTFVDDLGIESSASIEYVKTNTVQAIK